MKYILDPIMGLLASLFGLLVHPLFFFIFAITGYIYYPYLYALTAPFLLGALACLSVKWAPADETGYQRGKLPGWAKAWSTLDEDPPGDVRGEASVKWVYAKLGKTVATMYWLLERNRGMGLSYMLARKTSDLTYLDGNAWGFIEIPSGAWRWQQKLGPWFYVGVGTQTTRVGDDMWIRPWVGFKIQHGNNP